MGDTEPANTSYYESPAPGTRALGTENLRPVPEMYAFSTFFSAFGGDAHHTPGSGSVGLSAYPYSIPEHSLDMSESSMSLPHNLMQLGDDGSERIHAAGAEAFELEIGTGNETSPARWSTVASKQHWYPPTEEHPSPQNMSPKKAVLPIIFTSSQTGGHSHTTLRPMVYPNIDISSVQFDSEVHPFPSYLSAD